MSLRFFAALGCALSAFAFAAADAATFTYSFSFAPSYLPTPFTGSGDFQADDNGDGTFTITGATGSISSSFGTDTVLSVLSLDDYTSAPLLYASGDPASYSFANLRLNGANNVYDFTRPDWTDGDLFGSAYEAGGLATFTLARTDAPAETSDVPEAATWAMMVMGFGLTGAALRRRRVSVSFG